MPSADRGGRLIVLGSGAGGGLPQWNCGCLHCRLARRGDARVLARSQASIALSGDGRDWLLVNAAPDLRQQIADCDAVKPPGDGRGSPIRDVLVTGGEIDQIAGLLTLREGQAFRLHAPKSVHDILTANPVFDALRPDLVERIVLEAPARLETCGLSIEILPVPGKAPLYMEAGDDPAALADEGTLAILARPVSGGRSVAYVPGCAVVTRDLATLLERADIVLMDGTVYHDDELVRAGLGAKTGRRMGHLPIAGPEGTLGVLAGLAPRRRIYTHINNTNPLVLDGSPERLEVEALGVEIAFDGMEIAL